MPCAHSRRGNRNLTINSDGKWLLSDSSLLHVHTLQHALAYCRYLFANARGNRMKLLLHDGFCMLCAARRLNQGGFEWPCGGSDLATAITLTK